MVNHKGLYPHDFWAPPGGGVELGESASDALKREFNEECRVNIEVGAFLFGCEFIREPLHAVELFFRVNLNGNPALGFDPEMQRNQIISDLKFMTPSEVLSLPKHSLHGVFQKIDNPTSILDLRGFFTLT
jgi:8-oxo-dGTP diphosphatase